MFYRYTPKTTTGPYGTEYRFINTENNDGIDLGSIDGVTHYVFLPDDVQPPQQPEEINFEPVELTDDLKETIKQHRYVTLRKEITRNEIAKIGDIEDLIADCMKLVEFTIMLTSRIAADYLGTSPMSEEVKTAYAQRNQAFLDAVDSGDLIIRGEYDDVSLLQQRMMQRYSDINKIVRDRYINDLKRIGL